MLLKLLLQNLLYPCEWLGEEEVCGTGEGTWVPRRAGVTGNTQSERWLQAQLPLPEQVTGLLQPHIVSLHKMKMPSPPCLLTGPTWRRE